MHQNNLHRTLIGFVILPAMTACTLPIQTAPEISPSAIETAIASTLQAAAQQTKRAGLLTPTVTLAPTEALTSTPKISFYGTSLTVREDQSSVFVDHEAGIQLVIPPGWMPVRVNEDEYYKAFGMDVVSQTPAIHEHLTYIQDANVDVLRLNAIDLRPGHIQDEIVTNFNVIFEEGKTRSLEQWQQAERKRKSPYKHFKFISSSYPKINDGTRVLVIEQSWDAHNSTLYYRGVFFSLPSGTVVLDFFTNSDLKAALLADFDQVVNSLTLLNP